MQTEENAGYMTMAEFGSLPEYSCPLPTGTTAGKQWKREMQRGASQGIRSSAGRMRNR